VTTAARRAYGELDRDEVVASLQKLARRVGVQRVTMRELAAELGAAAPSVYYHVPGKQAALDLLAESVLAGIPEPGPGPWDTRLTELYGAARAAILGVPGIATVLQTHGSGERARRLSRLSKALIFESGLAKPAATSAHTVLYTYLLGSVTLQESRPPTPRPRSKRQEAEHFRAGLEVIIAGIRASAEER
jgi:TetR/AcrR family transcriptional regulator, tetracycline repressor protein